MTLIEGKPIILGFASKAKVYIQIRRTCGLLQPEGKILGLCEFFLDMPNIRGT